MARLLREWKLPCLIHQPSYNMLNRWIEGDLLDTLEKEGIGCIAFTPLAQGLLTGKYLHGVPDYARIKQAGGDSLKESHLSEENLVRIRALNEIASARGQSLAQMALAWVLRDSARHLCAHRSEPARAGSGERCRPQEAGIFSG